MPFKARGRLGHATRSIRFHHRIALVVLSSAALTLTASDALAAQAPVGLGTASSFAVLAGSAVTNTGPSIINGDLGVTPGTAVSGFPPGTVNGTIHAADAVAGQAQSDLTTAYNDAAGRTPALAVAGDLGGQTLTPGVYNSASSLGLTGQLTLNAEGDPNAVFIFQAGSSLTTASASDIDLINGAQACNVYWQVGSSATLGTASVFVGNILAYQSISMNNDVTVNGSALARNGAVTLIDDTITPAVCTPSTGTGSTGTGAGSTASKGTPGAGTSSAGKPAGGKPSGTSAAGKPAGTSATGTSHTGTSAASAAKAEKASALLATIPGLPGIITAQHPASGCVARPFLVTVTGHHISRVTFSLGARVIPTHGRAPFRTTISATGGVHVLIARVAFTDTTHTKRLSLRFRACTAVAAAAGKAHPASPVTPSGFTG
jgi:hypothetical protein